MKKKIILLPLIMMALASCGGNSSTSEAPKPSTSDTPSTSTKPSTSTGGTSTSQTPASVTSIADVIKAGFDGTSGTTEYTFEGTVVALIGDSYYIQQGDAGIYVYKKAATGNAIGKKVRVVSKITNYNGLIETDYASSAEVVGEGDSIAAVTYTTSTFKKENQCTLANIKGLTPGTNDPMNINNSSILKFKEGDNDVSVRVDKNLSTEVKTAIKEKMDSLSANDTVDFVNTILYMNSYNDTNTVTVGLTSADQIVITRGAKVDVTGVTADESIEVTVGKTTKITASVVPATATERGLTYTSNDTTKATVDDNGVVTGVALGETTITVASKDNPALTATVAVTVKEAAPAPDIDAAKFDLSSATDKGTQLTNDTALTLLNTAYVGETSPLQSVTVTAVYSGNGNGGAFSNASGFLKMSTGNVVGSLALDFGSLKATSIDIKCHDWYKDTNNGKSAESTITVNDSEAQGAPYTTAPEAQTLTFNFTESSVVTIKPSKRIFVFEFTVHFSK